MSFAEISSACNLDAECALIALRMQFFRFHSGLYGLVRAYPTLFRAILEMNDEQKDMPDRIRLLLQKC